jgi:tetratricopeptide (TPR) repeat protein
VDRVQETMGAMQNSMGALIRQAHTAIHTSSRQMPPKPSIFYGRDQFVEDIAKILSSASAGPKPPRICIHGPGGMGKTSAAITVMEHPDIKNKFTENDRFWVPCVSATSPDILLHILYLNLRISRDTGDYLSDIMTELQSSPAPRLMLLDNFETPWDPIERTREDVEKILHSLSALSQLSILVTMRTNIPPSEEIDWVDKPLDAVDPGTSKKIYCAIDSRAEGKQKLDELLVELSHMPFAIRLVATLGKRSKSTPEALLKDWHKHGPGMLSSDGSVEDSISRSIGLSMNSKTIAKNVPARTLLATLAMLPAGTTHSRLDWWIPELGNNKRRVAITALNNVALVVDTELDDSEVVISLLPVVQSYMQHGSHIPATVCDNVRNACYKLVLEHKSSPGDPTFKNDLLILSSEQMNIQSILLDASRTADVNTTNATPSPNVPDIRKVLEVLVAFCWYQHWTKPRTEVIEHTLKLAHEAGLEEFIAECLFCLGSTFFRLDRYKDAENSYAKARDYFKKLSNVVRASECSFEIVGLSDYIGNTSMAEEALGSVSEEDMNADAYLRAGSKMARGKFCWRIGQYAQALKHLTAAKEAFETKEINRPVDAAFCLHSISRVFASMGRIQDAVKAVDHCLDIYEKTGPDNRLAETLLVKDYILLKAHAAGDQVLPTLQRTLQKSQELGRPLAIAQALELLGEFHVGERDVCSAIDYYQAAQKQYETIDGAQSNIGRCQYNCNQLVLMEVDPDLEWQGLKLSDLF